MQTKFLEFKVPVLYEKHL